jgi:hypothetical protein
MTKSAVDRRDTGLSGSMMPRSRLDETMTMTMTAGVALMAAHDLRCVVKRKNEKKKKKKKKANLTFVQFCFYFIESHILLIQCHHHATFE